MRQRFGYLGQTPPGDMSSRIPETGGRVVSFTANYGHVVLEIPDNMFRTVADRMKRLRYVYAGPSGHN